MKTRNTAGWPVMAHCCASCPFGEHGDPRVKKSVVSRLLTLSHSQICHHPALHGKRETHLCRGARDFQLNLLHRMGFLSEPTDEAFAIASRRAS